MHILMLGYIPFVRYDGFHSIQHYLREFYIAFRLYIVEYFSQFHGVQFVYCTCWLGNPFCFNVMPKRLD